MASQSWGSAFSDWGGGGGSSGWGTAFTNWGGSSGGGGYSGTLSKSSGSGGGGGGSGGITGLFEHALGDVASSVENIFPAAYQAGRATAKDIYYGVTTGKSQHRLERQVVMPYLRGEQQSWGPLLGYAVGQGDIGKFQHRFYEHPLGPILDLLTIASLGGGAALKGASLADRANLLREGGALQQAARGERSISYQPPGEGGGGGITEPLRPGQTLQGRLLQNAVDRLREHPRVAEQPIIGAGAKVAKITAKRAFEANDARLAKYVRPFQRTVAKLSEQEKFAVHVAAGGVPLEERIAYYADRLAAEPGNEALQSYVARLQKVDPGILTKPRPEFVRAVSQARRLEAAGGDIYKAMGLVKGETREMRRFLEQRIVGGAKYAAEKTIGYTRTPGRPRRPIVTEPGWRGGPGLADLQSAETARLEGSVPGQAPELGPAFRTPHMVQEERKAARLFRSRRPPLGKPKTPSALHQNVGERFSTGRYQTDPAVYANDFMSAAQYAHQLNLQKTVLDKVAVDPTPAHFEEGWSWYRPGKTRSVPRSVTEKPVLDAEAERMGVGTRPLKWDEVVSRQLPSNERLDYEALREKGYKMVPPAFAQEWRNQFVGVSRFERLIIDRPLDFFRAYTLKFRPAWFATNLYGNSFLYLQRYLGHGALRSFLRAVQLEKGDAALSPIADFIQANQRVSKYGPLLEEISPGLGQNAFFKSQSYIRHRGVYADKDITPRSFVRTVTSPLTLPVRVAWHGVNRFGDAVMWVNTHSENLLRRAAFLNEAERNAAIRNIRRVSKQLEGVNLDLKGALGKAAMKDPATIERITQNALRAMGDFNNLSQFERRFMRKLLPFYSWYRTILFITAHGVIDQPLRWNLLSSMAQTASQNPSASLQGPFAPNYEFLSGSIPIGGESNGVQPTLSTQSANPFATDVQMGKALVGLVEGKPDVAASPTSFLNPFLVAGMAGTFGIDPNYGGAYKGLGEQHGVLGRALGSLIQGNPQYQTYLKASGQHKSVLYTPGQLDWLYNYLGIPIKRVNVAAARSPSGGATPHSALSTGYGTSSGGSSSGWGSAFSNWGSP